MNQDHYPMYAVSIHWLIKGTASKQGHNLMGYWMCYHVNNINWCKMYGSIVGMMDIVKRTDMHQVSMKYNTSTTRSQWNITQNIKYGVVGRQALAPKGLRVAKLRVGDAALRWCGPTPYLDALHGALDTVLAVHVTAGASVRDFAGAVADRAIDAGRCGCCGLRLRRGIIRVAHEFKSTP